MSFAHPLALLLLLLLIPVALLYWLRLRMPRVVVGTGPFWQQALAEEPFRARWQRWRTPVSLVLHMLTVILLAVAAAGPAISPPQRIVLILDNSATMRATDVQPSRFEAAKEAARRMIDSLRWCDEMAIVTTSPNPVEVQPTTSDQALLRAAVDSAQAQAEPPALAWAIKLARKISEIGKPLPRIMLISDGYDMQAASEAQTNGVEVVRVGTNASNRAITCFTARRSKIDPTQCEVFVEVRNNGNQTAQGNLQLSIDDRPGPSVSFAIEKDGRWAHVFNNLSLPAAARLTVRMTPGDVYPFDDTASLLMLAPLPVGAGPVDRTLVGALRQVNYSIVHAAPPHGNQKASADGEGGLAALYRTILLVDSHQTFPILYAEYLGPLYGDPNGVDMRLTGDVGKDASTVQYETLRLPLWIALAAVAVVLLILEWCLYLRLWTS